MDAAVRAAQCDDAWDFLAKMRAAGLHPDKFTASILIKGLAQSARAPSGKEGAAASKIADRVRSAVELLREIHYSLDATFAGSMYNTVFEAAAQLPDNTPALQVFATMRQCKIAPSETAMRRVTDMMRTTGPVAPTSPFDLVEDVASARLAPRWAEPWC